MAPVDIIISIINRKVAEAEFDRNTDEKWSPEWHENNGRVLGLTELKNELEGFKKLFS